MVSIGYEQLKFDENDNPIFIRTIDNNGKTEILTPEQKNLKKELTFKILFERVALNPKTMKNLSAWFVQDIRVKVPNREEYRYCYLYFEKGTTPENGMKNVCIKYLDVNMGRFCGFTTSISLNDKTFVKKIGEAKRVTTEIAKKMWNNNEILAVVNEEHPEETWVEPKKLE